MIFTIAAFRELTVSDGARTFTLEPGEPIFDPYLLALIARRGIRLRAF